MSYQSNSSLPDSVTGVLPKHAQDIYREAFNSAWDQYKGAGAPLQLNVMTRRKQASVDARLFAESGL